MVSRIAAKAAAGFICVAIAWLHAGCVLDEEPTNTARDDFSYATGKYCVIDSCPNGGPCSKIAIDEGDYCVTSGNMGGVCKEHQCIPVGTCTESVPPVSGKLCATDEDCCPPGPCYVQHCPLGSKRCTTDPLPDGTACDGGTCQAGDCVAN